MDPKRDTGLSHVRLSNALIPNPTIINNIVMKTEITNTSKEATGKNTKQTSYSKKKKGIFRKKKKTRVVGSVAF